MKSPIQIQSLEVEGVVLSSIQWLCFLLFWLFGLSSGTTNTWLSLQNYLGMVGGSVWDNATIASMTMLCLSVCVTCWTHRCPLCCRTECWPVLVSAAKYHSQWYSRDNPADTHKYKYNLLRVFKETPNFKNYNHLNFPVDLSQEHFQMLKMRCCPHKDNYSDWSLPQQVASWQKCFHQLKGLVHLKINSYQAFNKSHLKGMVECTGSGTPFMWCCFCHNDNYELEKSFVLQQKAKRICSARTYTVSHL